MLKQTLLTPSQLEEFEFEDEFAVVPRVSYTYQNFTFENDPIFGNNRLAGAPRHSGRVELGIEWKDFRIAPNVQFQSDTFVDFANTLQAPGFTTIGIEASYRANEYMTFYVDARNLEDQNFVTDASTIADARTAADLEIFSPGNGISFFAGVRIGFGGTP